MPEIKAPLQPRKHEEATIIDKLGRTIKFRQLSTRERSRLKLVLGDEGTKNESFFLDCYAAATLREVDGRPVMEPTKMEHLDDLFDLLGDEGIEAILLKIVEINKEENDPEKVVADAKN